MKDCFNAPGPISIRLAGLKASMSSTVGVFGAEVLHLYFKAGFLHFKPTNIYEAQETLETISTFVVAAVTRRIYIWNTSRCGTGSGSEFGNRNCDERGIAAKHIFYVANLQLLGR